MNADVLTNINKLFLDIVTCPLRVVHNFFLREVAALNFIVDHYALNMYFFFKLSAGRRADYKFIGDVTNSFRICYKAFNSKMGHTSKS